MWASGFPGKKTRWLLSLDCCLFSPGIDIVMVWGHFSHQQILKVFWSTIEYLGKMCDRIISRTAWDYIVREKHRQRKSFYGLIWPHTCRKQMTWLTFYCINLSICLYAAGHRGKGSLESIPMDLGEQGGGHMVSWCPSQGTLTHTCYRQFRDVTLPIPQVFGLKEETGETQGSEHANSVHDDRRRESNPQPWRCEVPTH